MAWYSATHSEIDSSEEGECPQRWNWRNQKLWNWEDGETMKLLPLTLFDDLETFDFSDT